MNKRVFAMFLSFIMLLACLPASVLFIHADEALPTIYVMEDVYGIPGETVKVKIGFKNTAGKNIQQFEANLSAGEATVLRDTALKITPTPALGGTGFSNPSGRFGFACGIGSFTPDSYATLYVTIPETAVFGDTYDLTLSEAINLVPEDPNDPNSPMVETPTFPEILKWEGGISAEGNVAFEGAALHVVDEAYIFNMDYEWEVIDEDAGTARLLSYRGNDNGVVVPSTAFGNGVTGTDGKEYTVVELYGDNETYDGIFSGNETVTSIEIPESVKIINEYAITECTALEKLIVKSPDVEIIENDGDTFLHYYAGKKEGYKVSESLVIHSYESATIKTWADDNDAGFENLFAFVGAQQGDDAIRFIGAVANLEYRRIDLAISVAEADKAFSNPTMMVYRTLNGTVDGELTPVVTTDAAVAEDAGAYLVNGYNYLFGYAITGVPTTGTYSFEITPTAVTKGGVTVTGEIITVQYVDGQLVIL